METIIYYDAGDTYLGSRDLTTKQEGDIKRRAKELGHIGYLTGFHSIPYGIDSNRRVLCFFKQEPSLEEIARRKANGFANATYWTL